MKVKLLTLKHSDVPSLCIMAESDIENDLLRHLIQKGAIVTKGLGSNELLLDNGQTNMIVQVPDRDARVQRCRSGG